MLVNGKYVDFLIFCIVNNLQEIHFCEIFYEDSYAIVLINRRTNEFFFTKLASQCQTDRDFDHIFKRDSKFPLRNLTNYTN